MLEGRDNSSAASETPAVSVEAPPAPRREPRPSVEITEPPALSRARERLDERAVSPSRSAADVNSGPVADDRQHLVARLDPGTPRFLPRPPPLADVPPPPSPAPANLLDPLLGHLAPLIAEFPGLAGVAVLDLQTGETIDLRGEVQFQAASTIKFFAILSALTDIENGLYELDAIADDLYGVMVLQSNAAARRITLKTGIPTINERLGAWGLQRTIIAHPSGFRAEQDPDVESADNFNLTAPSDAVRALQLLHDGALVSPDLSRTLIERMTQAPRWFGIEGAVPDEEGHVFYKVGWLPEYSFSSVNDIGIVEFEREGETLAYAIAIYTQGAVPQWPAWILVRDLAVATWEFFAQGLYPPTTVVASVGANRG